MNSHCLKVLELTSRSLSAIMLGRLQLRADEALEQYSVVGAKVFARKRYDLLTMYGVVKNRYKSRYLARAFQAISARSRLDTPAKPPNGNGEVKKAKTALGRKYDRIKADERQAKHVRLANGNPDGPRTIVVAHGGDDALEVQLFRSYDHPVPNEPADARGSNRPPRPKHHRPLAAANVPLWKRQTAD